MTETNVIVTKVCTFCSKTAKVSMPPRAFINWHRKGVNLQHAWPESTPDQREIAITGTHPECWDKYMKDKE